MDIDTTQPWGIALDYFGRATITESGHTLRIRVYDQSLGEPLAPDPLTGGYPQVYVTAQLTENGSGDSQLRGYGEVVVRAEGTAPVAPDQTAVQSAVAAALSDFTARTAAYAELCASWPAPAPAPGDGDGSGDGSGGSDPDPGTGDGSGTDPGDGSGDPDPDPDPAPDPNSAPDPDPGDPVTEPEAGSDDATPTTA